MATKFLEMVRDTYLFQYVNNETRFRGDDQPSLLDLIFTNEENMQSAAFRMYSSLTSHGYSKSIKAVRRQRNLGLEGMMIHNVDAIEHNAPLGNSDDETLEFNFKFGVKHEKHYQHKLSFLKGNYTEINTQLISNIY